MYDSWKAHPYSVFFILFFHFHIFVSTNSGFLFVASYISKLVKCVVQSIFVLNNSKKWIIEILLIKA